jgi:2,4-dienoyl-CoA reductase-like NADH-dependent reductase (Old Yellow Enzyme family)
VAQWNHRTDEYGGSSRNRARLVVEIVEGIRKEVPASFCVGIKLNSVDQQESGDLEETLEQIKFILDSGVDFLEISGGSYEDPKVCPMRNSITNQLANLTEMFSDVGQNPAAAKSTRTKLREAFFLDFARIVRSRFPSAILMVTGGFRTIEGMHAALEENACDLIGLGRPAVVNPAFARELLQAEDQNRHAGMQLQSVQPDAIARLLPISVLGAGAESVSCRCPCVMGNATTD